MNKNGRKQYPCELKDAFGSYCETMLLSAAVVDAAISL
jgi:hypothetical protein